MKKDIKVLFIGNSHTYFNEMPYMLECIADSITDGVKIDCSMLADGGRTLNWHYTQPDVRFNILHKEYDYIILQNKAHPFDGIEELDSGVAHLLEFINYTKAKVILYMTWARKDEPENQEEMTNAYTTVAKKYNVMLAPVGEYFKKIQQETSINLFNEDNAHASSVGSYLIALTMYNILTNQKPTGAIKSIDNVLGNIVTVKNDEYDYFLGLIN